MSATPNSSSRWVERARKWLISLTVAGSLLAGAAIVVIGFASILNAIWHLRDAEAIDLEEVERHQTRRHAVVT